MTNFYRIKKQKITNLYLLKIVISQTKVKKYRFSLLEKLRQKTIRLIKDKRKELIQKEKNKEEDDEEENKGKLTQNFNISETENQAANLTFTEKMNNMITRERANIMKIKQKQKQNIEFMIELKKKREKNFMIKV